MNYLHFENVYNEILDFHYNHKLQQIDIEGFCTQTFVKDKNHRDQILQWIQNLSDHNVDQLSFIFKTSYIDSQIFKILLEAIQDRKDKVNIIIRLGKSSMVYKNMYANTFKDKGVEIIVE